MESTLSSLLNNPLRTALLSGRLRQRVPLLPGAISNLPPGASGHERSAKWLTAVQANGLVHVKSRFLALEPKNTVFPGVLEERKF